MTLHNQHDYDQFLRIFQLAMDRTIPELQVPPHHNRTINVGCSHKHILGSQGYDANPPKNDCHGVIEWKAPMRLPIADETVGHIHCYHFLEHLTGDDVILTLQDFQRVLSPRGIVNILVPYYNSHMQGSEIDHKTAFTEKTWAKIFFNTSWSPDHEREWQFEVGTNLIVGVVERNLALFTQLIKTP